MEAWEDRRSRKCHKLRLKNVKPTSQTAAAKHPKLGIDFTTPVGVVSGGGAKKLINIRERKAEIARENERLAKKINEIWSHDPVKEMEPGSGSKEYAPGVRIDSLGYPHIDCHLNVKPSPWACGAGMSPDNLYKLEHRSNEYRRIIFENKLMAKRIITTPAVIDRHAQVQDWKRMNDLYNCVKKTDFTVVSFPTPGLNPKTRVGGFKTIRPPQVEASQGKMKF